MVCPSSLLLSAAVVVMAASTWRCEATSVMTCMMCNVITQPLQEDMTPTATVSTMFKECDKMGLMRPVCEQFVSENVREIFHRIKRGIPPDGVCETMRFCEDK